MVFRYVPGSGSRCYNGRSIINHTLRSTMPITFQRTVSYLVFDRIRAVSMHEFIQSAGGFALCWKIFWRAGEMYNILSELTIFRKFNYRSWLFENLPEYNG
jgi:hypothetical protein